MIGRMTNILLGSLAISIPVALILWLMLRNVVRKGNARLQASIEESFQQHPDPASAKAMNFLTGTRFGRSDDPRPFRVRHPDVFLISSLFLSSFIICFIILLNYTLVPDQESNSDTNNSTLQSE